MLRQRASQSYFCVKIFLGENLIAEHTQDRGIMRLACDRTEVNDLASQLHTSPHLLWLTKVPDDAVNPLIAGGPDVEDDNVVVAALKQLSDNVLTEESCTPGDQAAWLASHHITFALSLCLCTEMRKGSGDLWLCCDYCPPAGATAVAVLQRSRHSSCRNCCSCCLPPLVA